MAELIARLRTQVMDWYGSLDKRMRWVFIGGGIAFIIIVALAIMLVTRPKYVVLNRNLDLQKAGEITTKLDELGIAYKTEDNTSTILVEEKSIDKARMDLTLSGLTSSEGFSWDDVWSQITFTQTTEEKNRMFLLAQQTEIADSLRTLQNVEAASVILNVKATSSFLNLEEDVSSASVRLTVRGGKTLSDEQVQGIVNYITSAVKGLTADKITVIDQTGAQLNQTGTDSEVGFSNRQDELKVTVENRLDKNIAEFLGEIYGPDNVLVKANVKLDFDKEVTNIVQFTTPIEGATEGLLRSMNTLKENVVNGAAGGAAGTDTNTAETPNFPTSTDGNSDYTKSQEILNYELNELQKTITKAEGQITNVSVAIIINQKVLVDEILTEEHKTEVMQLVAAATGVADTKGVTVVAKNFYVEPEIPLGPKPFAIFNVPVWVFGVILGIVAVAGLVTFIMIRRRASSLKVAQEIIEEQEELEEINTEFQDKSSPKYQIEKFIDSKPEAVAQLLRSWLNED